MNQFCNLVQRNAVGVVTVLDDIETNVGNIQTQGVDLRASTTAFNTRVGEFTRAVPDYIHFGVQRVAFRTLVAGRRRSTTCRLGGRHRLWLEPLELPEEQVDTQRRLERGNWSALWRMRYIGAMIENCTGFTQYRRVLRSKRRPYTVTGVGLVPTNRLGSTVYNDASVNLPIPFDTTAGSPSEPTICSAGIRRSATRLTT